MQLTNARAWVIDTLHWSEADQEATVREWHAENMPGTALVVYRGSERKRAVFLRALRPGEAAIVPRLDVLVDRDSKHPPSLDLTMAVSAAIKAAAVVIDVASMARSDDAKRWEAAIVIAHKKIKSGSGGRKLGKKAAREMQGASVRSRRNNSAIARWMADERLRAKWRPVYKSVEYPNWTAARAALPSELHTASRSSCDRLFGGRTQNQ